MEERVKEKYTFMHRKIDLASFREFSTPEEVKKWVDQNYSQKQLDLFDLRKHLHDPIGMYKGSGYEKMNDLLDKGLGKSEEGRWWGIDKLQDQLLNQVLSENICVTRFVKPKELLKWEISTWFHKTMICKRFLSTTLLREYFAMEDIKKGRTTIKIYIPSGAPGAYIPEVNLDRSEYEILVSYGMRFVRVGYKKYCLIIDDTSKW